jgi:hypothetical protein
VPHILKFVHNGEIVSEQEIHVPAEYDSFVIRDEPPKPTGKVLVQFRRNDGTPSKPYRFRCEDAYKIGDRVACPPNGYSVAPVFGTIVKEEPTWSSASRYCSVIPSA